jgi:hypothetical protein
MKHFIDRRIVMATTLAVTILAFMLSSCSSDGDKVKIDARFLNMNQASFYVYSPDGAINGIDTITVNGGRFTYEKEIVQDGTLVLVFPNYAVMPVFVKPGASISIDANAAHLKIMEITGTDDNKTFTEWRQNSDKLSPAEMKGHAELFIKDNPKSMVSIWLVRQYFLLSEKPDLKKAQAMLKTMTATLTPEERTSPTGLLMARLYAEISKLTAVNVGDPLPRFTAKDIDGKPVTNGIMLKGTTVICVWTTWNYESCNVLRQLASNKQFSADSAKIDNVLTICLDPDRKMCRNTLKSNNAEMLTTVCDTLMWDSPLVKALGITTIPYNLKIKNGKITGRCIPIMELLKK